MRDQATCCGDSPTHCPSEPVPATRALILPSPHVPMLWLQQHSLDLVAGPEDEPSRRRRRPPQSLPGPDHPRKPRPGSAPSPPEPVQTPHHGSGRDEQMDHLRLHRDQIHPGLPLRRLGSFDERIGACSEEGCTVTKTLASLKPAATAEGIHPVHPRATFNQRHLRRKVVALEHFH